MRRFMLCFWVSLILIATLMCVLVYYIQVYDSSIKHVEIALDQSRAMTLFKPIVMTLSPHNTTKRQHDESPKLKNRIAEKKESIRNMKSIPVYFYKKQSDQFHVFRGCEYLCHMKLGMSKEENTAVVFHAPSLDDYFPFKKRRGQIWIFFSQEPPWLHPSSKKLKMWKNLFNWTLGYRRDADFYHEYGHFEVVPKVNSNRFIVDWDKRENKSIWFVSHCGVDSQREEYVSKLNTFYKTDTFGRCGNLKCPKSDWGRCHDKIKNYKFSIAFENSLCRDYITEKAYKVYWYQPDAIPVVRGTDNYDLYLPPRSYLNSLNYKSPKLLAKHMNYLSTNVTESMTYFNWKYHYSAKKTDAAFCDLCKRLHDDRLIKKHTRVYQDIDAWLRGHDGSRCRRPTDIV